MAFSLGGRRITLSLRAFLCFTLLCSVCLGLLINLCRARRQQDAASYIRQHGGEIIYGGIPVNEQRIVGWTPPGPAWLRSWIGEGVFLEVAEVNLGVHSMGYAGGEADIELLRQFPRLIRVGIYNPWESDPLIEAIARFGNLEEFTLIAQSVSPQALSRLARLKRLKRLMIHTSDLGDEHVKWIADLPHLEGLDLAGCQLSDAGLASLSGLTSLKRLNLSGEGRLPGSPTRNQITDAGLTYLAGMSNLEFLNLCFTRVSDQGLGALKQLAHLDDVWLEGSLVTWEGKEELFAEHPRLRAAREARQRAGPQQWSIGGPPSVEWPRRSCVSQARR